MIATYNFPALRGIQAGREFYLAMCPLGIISNLTLYDEACVPPELRAQRVLNRSRLPEMVSYLVDHPKEYVFSAITVSVGNEVEFNPNGDSPQVRNVGMLEIPMSAQLIVNDGQHRRAAIKDALQIRPELVDESIPVVFFIDSGLRNAQQMFADLNKHAVRPSQSLGILYDHRDPLAALVRELMIQVPLFKDLTEKEKTSISNRSTKLFTLSGIYQATRELIRYQKGEAIEKEQADHAHAYWSALGEIIPEWAMAVRKQVAPVELREQYVHAHGVAIQALGGAGACLFDDQPLEWKKILKKVGQMDWSRSNIGSWEGRAMLQGKISKATRQVALTVNLIKQTLGLPLSESEQSLETRFLEDEFK